MKKRISDWVVRWQIKTGATLVEYTFIIAIVSIIGVVLLASIGKNTNNLLESTNSNMPK